MTWLSFHMTSADFRSDSAAAGRDASVSKQLTAAEVADVLRVGTFAVIEMCRSGHLPASKPGKSWLIDPADLRAHLEAHSNQRESA